ncbi:hypothetical protein THAOC_09940, partial [Thalassiosira oceanica]
HASALLSLASQRAKVKARGKANFGQKVVAELTAPCLPPSVERPDCKRAVFECSPPGPPRTGGLIPPGRTPPGSPARTGFHDGSTYQILTRRRPAPVPTTQSRRDATTTPCIYHRKVFSISNLTQQEGTMPGLLSLLSFACLRVSVVAIG